MAKKRRRTKSKSNKLSRWWLKFEYRHTTSAILLIVLFVIGFDTAVVQTSLDEIHDLGLLGMIIGGAMYTSFFTTAPAIAILTSLTDNYPPLAIALIGGLGAVIGDLIILRFFEEKIGFELMPLVKKFKLNRFLKKIRRKKSRDRTTVAGMLAIASPLPDEIGIGLLGLAHLPSVVLVLILYLLKTIGILLIVYGSQLL